MQTPSPKTTTADSTREVPTPSLLGIVTDNPSIRMDESGEFAFIYLKRPLKREVYKGLNLVETDRLENGELKVIKMRMPRVFDRLAVGKMPGCLGNPVQFEFEQIVRAVDLPSDVLDKLSMGDWENLQDALEKLND